MKLFSVTAYPEARKRRIKRKERKIRKRIEMPKMVSTILDSRLSTIHNLWET
jgi:hypothetical protein